MGKKASGKKDKKLTAEEEAEAIQQAREVQERLEELNQQADQLKYQIRRCEIESQRSSLTLKEIEPLADETKMYRQVGKMFLLQPKPDLAKHLQANAALKTVESNQLKQALQKLGEQATHEANSLKEIIGDEKMKQTFGPNAGK
mmetsp:Transcript_53547/g.114459  ORF Transcript_53547/g.114459 Transcript_53547/m.114459 type:complete len:144 (-) Transcript_53547:33-464(-)